MNRLTEPHVTSASTELSRARQNLLRAMYLGNLVLLGLGVWPRLIDIHRTYDPLAAVALCFWAALGALSVFGLRFPLAMVPLLLVQFLYKVLWILAVWLPLQVTGAGVDTSVGRFSLSVMFLGGAVSDLIVIPWRYVFSRFVRADAEDAPYGRGLSVQIGTGRPG